jgi:hypothetical protein
LIAMLTANFTATLGRAPRPRGFNAAAARYFYAASNVYRARGDNRTADKYRDTAERYELKAESRGEELTVRRRFTKELKEAP